MINVLFFYSVYRPLYHYYDYYRSNTVLYINHTLLIICDKLLLSCGTFPHYLSIKLTPLNNYFIINHVFCRKMQPRQTVLDQAAQRTSEHDNPFPERSGAIPLCPILCYSCRRSILSVIKFCFRIRKVLVVRKP